MAKTTSRNINHFKIDLTKIMGKEYSIFDLFKKFKENSENNIFQFRIHNEYPEAFQIDEVNDKIVKARVLRIREDLWPQVLNLNTVKISDLILDDGLELIESAHFIISKEHDGQIHFLMEYNHYGSKEVDFLKIVDKFGVKEYEMFAQVNVNAVKVDSEKILKGLKRLSQIQIKIDMNYVQELADKEMIDALIMSNKVYKSRMIQINWNIDEEPNKQSVIDKLKAMLSLNSKKAVTDVKIHCVKENMKKLEWLNLLDCYSSYQVHPKMRSKRVLESEDMYEKIIEKLDV